MNKSPMAWIGLVIFMTWIAVDSPFASSLPRAIQCYRDSTQSKDIAAYLSCFADHPTIIDVNRTLAGKKTIREWALREVIPYGEQFKHRQILEQNDNYAKTLVRWMVWDAHYHYWWDDDDKITKMSLQYAD